MYINATEIPHEEDKYDENSNSQNGYVFIRHVHEIIFHPEYDASNYNNDIALIRLNRPVNTITTTTPLPSLLPTRNDDNDNNNKLLSIGFDILEEKIETSSSSLFPKSLQEVNLRSIPCKNSSNTTTNNNNSVLCVTTTDDASCSSGGGNPGGPILNNLFQIVGIVSFGMGCNNTIDHSSSPMVSCYYLAFQ